MTDTAIEQPVVKYQPTAPVGSQSNLKSLLEQLKSSLSQAMPKHVTPDRIIKTMLVAANRNPDLFECTQSSVIETISRAAELGLDLSGTLGEAYPVPFNNRVKERWLKQCQLIIGYRGLAKLARQSGEISYIEAEVVCENDLFEFEKGINAKCRWRPPLKGERGEPIGAYALVKFKDGGVQFDFMTLSDIETIRRRSKSGSDKDTGEPIGPWKTDWPELAKKTVFRRLAKWLPLSPEKADKFYRAVEVDNEDYQAGMQDVVGVQLQSGVAALRNRLAGQPAESKPTATPTAEATSAAEPQAEAITEQPEASETAGEPAGVYGKGGGSDDKWVELVKALANNQGCTMEEADKKLSSYVSKVMGINVNKLTNSHEVSIAASIKRGDIKV